ncbi:MAG: glycosyltransferase family 2 protein [Patescibacteria group bacterium]
MPKISVIMSAYNAEKDIRKSIDSILNQTFKDFELIIINDGSTDSTKNIVENYTDSRIKIINHDINQGIYSARSDGLRVAQGEFIAILDSDDISIKNRLEEQLNFMIKHLDIAVVGSWIETMDVKSGKIDILKCDCDPTMIKWMQILKNQIFNSSSFFRKKIIDKIGHYRKEYEYAEDYDLWSRISKKYKMENIPKTLIQYKIRSKSVSRALKTSKLQKRHILEIIFNNINYYIKLERRDFKIFAGILKEGKIPNFRNLIKVKSFYRKLFKAYIEKEKLSNNDIKKIFKDYKKNSNSISKSYLKNKFSKTHNLYKKLFK